MLTEREVVDYLLDRGLLSTETVVDGDLAIYDATRRNRNFRIVSVHGPSYLVKQGFGAEGRATVANEAGVYQALAAGGARVARYVPAFHGYEPEHGLLVLELIERGRSLTAH